jgi:glycosyltransferase involved in cell wall biosynthesis
MDNHSTDRSFEVAEEIAKRDPAVRVVRLSRNFGYQANILHGLLVCKGDAAIQLDADGEDDPALIPEFVRRWEQGFKVVYGIRRSRREGPWITFQRKVFYRLVSGLSSFAIPPDAGDFRLLDRRVLTALSDFKESRIYLRGLISYIGFDQAGIAYDRRPRYRGASKFSWWDYLELALTGITSFSSKPLRIATWLGLLFASTSFAGMVFYLGLFLSGRVGVKGFTTLILVNLLLSGVQLLCIGLMGVYVGGVFEEVKRRPWAIVEKTLPAGEPGPREPQ